MADVAPTCPRTNCAKAVDNYVSCKTHVDMCRRFCLPPKKSKKHKCRTFAIVIQLPILYESSGFSYSIMPDLYASQFDRNNPSHP